MLSLTLFVAWCVALPQDSAARSAAIVNVRDHGAKGDGVTDDHNAVQAAVNAASKGSTVYFPAGTYYFATGVRPENRTHLKFVGEPGAVIKAAGGKGGFLFAFKNCSDITITGLSLDLNGVTHFGPGMSFHACSRIRIDKNHFYDGNFQPKMTVDRYAICFGLGATMNEDLWITENLIEHLQVEIDKARRVHVLNNRSLAPELATGFGSFTLAKNILLEDVEFVGNYVEDPQAYGINVAADGEREGAVFRRILIANNIIMCKKRAPMLAGIMVGSRDGKAVRSALWEGVTVANNQVWYAKGIHKRHEESGIRVQVINPGEQIGKVTISGNIVIDEGGIANWGIETRGLQDAVICNNSVYGGRGGILLGKGWTRVVVQGNRVSDVKGDAYCLKGSQGANHVADNFAFGKVGAPFVAGGLQPSDRVQPVASPAEGSAAPPPAQRPATPTEKSDVTGEMVRIANAATLSESFDSLDGVKSSRSTGAERETLQPSPDQKREGSGAARLSWKSGSGAFQAAMVTIHRTKETDITGRSFEVWVMPLDENAGSWRVIFTDAAGQVVETQQLQAAKSNQWTCMKFTQGREAEAGWYYRKGPGDPTKVVKVQFAGTIHEKAPPGTPAGVIWDGFEMLEASK